VDVEDEHSALPGLESRGPVIKYSDVKCTHPPTYLDKIFTLSQRKFIGGIFCPFVANA
jgi:hypothetical protein